MTPLDYIKKQIEIDVKCQHFSTEQWMEAYAQMRLKEWKQKKMRDMLLDFADYSEKDKTSQTTDECVDNYFDLIFKTEE